MKDYRIFGLTEAVGLNRTERKIRAFAKLQPGWRLGSGESFSESVLNLACRINKRAVELGFVRTDAFPGKSGDVSVVLYDGDDRFDFRIRPDSIRFSHERNGEDVEEEVKVTLDDSLNRIKSIKEGQWKLFYTSTFAILNQDLEGFDLRLLRGQAMGAESLLWIRNASLNPPVAYADTPYDFIQTPLINPSYFGNSNPMNCSPIAAWRHNRAILETNATGT
jgi:hypothetical protein